MTGIPELPKITSEAEFYAQALAIEAEASERYTLLAEQMEVHNNREAAEIFRKMAEIESQHRETLRRRAGSMLVGGEPARFSWTGPEGPETAGFENAHYLMSPHHALQVALINEKRAAAWYEAIAAEAADPGIKAAAAEMARDEHEHVAWVGQWLKKFPPPEQGWDQDPDPPVLNE